MVAVTKEGVFSTNILLDMHAELTKVLKVLTDSQSGRDVVCNAGATKHTVHFERWLYYVRDMYLRKKLMIELVTTVKMRADDKTKVVDKSKFFYCRKYQLNIKAETKQH